MTDPLLDAILNLSKFHREHEKFYAQQPREQAVNLQRHSRALCALADRWTTAAPARLVAPLNPYEGADDLNAPEAIQLDGILFMEGEGEPAEITRIKNDLRTIGDGTIAIGTWLGTRWRTPGRPPWPSWGTPPWPTSSVTGTASSRTTGRRPR